MCIYVMENIDFGFFSLIISYKHLTSSLNRKFGILHLEKNTPDDIQVIQIVMKYEIKT